MPRNIVHATTPKRNRPRKPAAVLTGSRIVIVSKVMSAPKPMATRIVTYIPKRRRDAWRRYLILTGLSESPNPRT
jgi:hypothetical protein